MVPSDGSSAPRLVREGRSDPSFDVTGTRVFVNDFRQGKAVLISVGIGDPSSPLSGGDDVVHFQSENATQIVPSPDGKWIAFSERWHAFVAPSGAVAFVGARVITMDGATVVENGTVVVEGNRVTAVGRDVAIPAGAKRIDASGKTIMPGIIDVH